MRTQATRLTQTQREQFARDGFLVLEHYVEPELVNMLRARMAALLATFEPEQEQSAFIGNNEASDDRYFLESGSEIRYFLEPDARAPDGRLVRDKDLSMNKVGHALHRLDPVFEQATGTLGVRELASQLGHRQPLPLQSMYLFKQPRIGAPVALHQDATFLYTEPSSVLGFWLALDDATEENGCLWALPGGHELGLKRRMRRLDGAATRMEILDATPFPEAELTPLPVASGSLVVLHGLLPHLSQPNRSSRPRHAYSLHLIDGATHYPQDNWLQPLPQEKAS
ncbi:MAG: phytanoyl-CoA dioxygenase family protein [Pseudomonadota bacterium]